MRPVYGITQGDSSGVGPEILLKAFAHGELGQPFVVFGDLSVIQHYKDLLGYSVPIRTISSVSAYEPGAINVLDQGAMQAGEITPGQLNQRSGAAAREYVVRAARAALAGEIAAMVTLPMNKEATQLSDPKFVGH